ncbi:MAG TPA: LCP family protein [Acidimicrobiales bacterium]|nr:LCP family protein [Acidimicrobiales bacterium]
MAQPAGLPRAGLRQRPWRGRLRTGLAAFVALCVVLVGASYLYFRHQLSRLNRLDIPGLADDTANVMNVLLVGSDTRDTATGDIADATGKGDEGTAGQRSDTIMILHIDPKQQKAAILSIPRDLYVTIPGSGRDKINAAFSVGGPPLLIRTIKETLGVEINHYVEVDFAGFERIVNTIGGVKVYVDHPARDFMTGLDIPSAGCNELDGYQALAYVRSRYYETYERGRWVSGSNSDLDRIARQQDFIRRIMKKAVSAGLTNPLTLNRLIDIGVDNVRVDQQMSTKDITTLARRFRSIDPDTVDMLTLPTVDGYGGGAAVQVLDTKNAQEYIDRLNGLTVDTSSVKPGDVSVKVLNGNGTEGLAGRAASALQLAGFRVALTGDAPSHDYQETVVQYAPGQEAKAAFLRSLLNAGASVEQDRTLSGADVALVLGADYDGLQAPPTAGAPGPAPAPGPSVPETTAPKPPPC